MPTVRFTPNLKRFFPDLQTTEVEAKTIAQLVIQVNQRWDGLADYIVDEHGRLRKHVNIFIGEDQIHDEETLSDPLNQDSKVFIMQALSGG